MANPTLAAGDVMRRINQAWLEGRPRDLAPYLHPDIVMALPGFTGKAQGRDALLAGFVDFCEHARVHAYEEGELHADVVGDTAVVSYSFEMVYERNGECYRSTGRDLWVMRQQDGEWLAIWRTMLDVAEEPAPPPGAPADR